MKNSNRGAISESSNRTILESVAPKIQNSYDDISLWRSFMQEERFTPELIAPCGMTCGACLAYLRERNRCPGCKGSDKDKPITRTKCKIKTCIKMVSGFCSDCEDFPCDRLNHLDKRYRSKYNMSMIANLKLIQANGIEQFLIHETERWKCPACGGVICIHNRICQTCKQSR